MTDIKAQLYALQDDAYRDFQCAAMPTVDPETVIGVRTPQLRRLAKAFAKEARSADFLRALPHDTYEENNLHAYLIEEIRGFDACLAAVDIFLPYVDNWATCDGMNPRALIAEPERLLEAVRRWLRSGETYTVRFGMVTLMRHFMGARFDPAYLDWAAQAAHGDYYVRMGAAWLFATALTHQYDAALPFMESRRLSPWVHNKAIQKAVESRLIPVDKKAYLRTLRAAKKPVGQA